MNEREFKNPGKIYRPSPFWSWNDKLEEEELRWQVREFADKGFGGYFMHARIGLATEYLSNEWMNCIKACLDEGKRVNLESWLYDEDRWPSGFAGGIVPAKSDKYRVKFLSMKEVKAEDIDELLADPSVQAIYEVQFSSGRITSYRRITGAEQIEGKGRLLAFKAEIDRKPSRWFNEETYVDLLNPKVTEEFLRVTLDAYAERFKDEFGEFMPGIFTDEPNYSSDPERGIPWTDDLPEYFRSLNGYDLRDKLPLLYFKAEGYHKVRYDFWRTVTLKFVESYTKLYAKRCDELGLKLTGHMLCEDNLHIQIRRIGAAMPHYEYMQIPGIDHLGRNIDNPLTLKQCSSVAHQFGRTRVLSELFGCSGHSMTFEDQKWIGDFHFALGITFFCPHLSLYTMRGNAKRDYPPTFSYHQPYWEHFKLLNDYFARASYVCSQGEFKTDILVLHPIGSAWATYTPSEKPDPELWRYNEELVKLQSILLEIHRDFDYGDEIIISRHGRVENGSFIINKSKYKVVVVPPSLTWSEGTVELLEKFLESGGKVIFVGETPSLIDGEPNEGRWRRILSHPNVWKTENSRKSLTEVLDEAVERDISIVDEDGEEIGDIIVHHRVDGSRHIYFLANTSRTRTYEAIIKFSQVGEVTEWDLFNGEVSRVEAVTQVSQTILRAVFHPVGSHVFVVDTSKPPHPKGTLPRCEVMEDVRKLSEKWGFKRLHPNSFVIDSCEYRFDDGGWMEKKPIWKIRLEAWRRAGLERYIEAQPWILIKKRVKPTRIFKLSLRASFKSEIKPKRLFLVMEEAEKWMIQVNGAHISADTSKWYWDKKFRMIDISEHVIKGENVIEATCTFDWNTPIEDIYLVGDFGVKRLSETEYAITDEPEMLSDGSWVEQGYPFYAGTMRYETEFDFDRELRSDERIMVRLPEAKGTLFLVRVNDSEPIPICWRPLEADVTGSIRRGRNKLTIDVVSSLRNTFGPLHHKAGDLYMVGPHSFRDEENWTDSYQLVPYGLIKGVELVIRSVKYKGS
ncbi:hypothetical protein DRO37_04745 [Candidatus Bathyarchaeota archaeon]|nr:MAG: hypothetical protein DRO37_04745 [Candidatus Bathyarchaeota archaeon]